MSGPTLISRKEAKARGKKRFYTGKSPCKRGHLAERYVSDGACCECAREASRRQYANDPEKANEATRRWQAANPNKVLRMLRRWKAAHPQKVHEQARRQRERNRQKKGGM
jgi:hypothetical protein